MIGLGQIIHFQLRWTTSFHDHGPNIFNININVQISNQQVNGNEPTAKESKQAHSKFQNQQFQNHEYLNSFMFYPNQRHVGGRTMPNLVQNYLKDFNIV
jgi:hypothetical protein